MVTQAIDIHTDPSFSGTMDPDMALNNSLGLVVTMTPDSSVGLSDQNGPSSSLVLLTSTWPQGAAQTLGSHTVFDGKGLQHRP